MYASNYAQHIAEEIAEAEGIDLDMVDVQEDGENIDITVTTESGKLTATMHEGESLKDLQWKDAS